MGPPFEGMERADVPVMAGSGSLAGGILEEDRPCPGGRGTGSAVTGI